MAGPDPERRRQRGVCRRHEERGAKAKIPVVALSPSMAVASKDELAGEVPLMRQFEQLLWIIKVVLGSPAGSVTFWTSQGLPSQPETFAQ